MMTKVGWMLVLALFALSLKDVFTREHSEDAHDEEDFKKEFGDEDADKGFSEGTEDEHIEVREQSHFGKPQQPVITTKDLPPIRFDFCVSCGYRQAFDQYSQFIHEKYPNMQVEGQNYPTAPWKSYLAQFLGIFKLALIASVISGSNPFERLGFGYPTILQWAHNNKLSSCMMAFLLSNMVESSLLSSGAFEVYLGKELLWSKLESGRVPAPAELMQMIDSQLELQGLIPSSTGSFSQGFEKVQ
ncbi:unnamed protein product, partial [Mesorhabditis belari]|uniref:SelT-like protein n=1 Tax=Mesorhabditis belari TaxID=2138241 RepID=A0AAF3EUW2_9BILA